MRKCLSLCTVAVACLILFDEEHGSILLPFHLNCTDLIGNGGGVIVNKNNTNQAATCTDGA